MAKAMIAVVLCALLVASVVAQDVKYDCDSAKQIGKVSNACNLLCQCAGALDKSLSGDKKDKEIQRCKDQCGSCSKAADSCKAGSALPKECAEGTSNQYVKQCITTYLKSQGNKG